MSRARRRPRVLHVQFSDPGLYPPVINASAMLTEAGFSVDVIGVRPQGALALSFPLHSGVRELTHSAPRAGLALKRFYATFALDVARAAERSRPDWLYVSDPMAAPIGLLARRASGARVVYHEHDAPGPGSGAFQRLVNGARARLARTADIAVAPAAARAELLRRDAGRGPDVEVVWNCPRLHELPALSPHAGDRVLRVLYSGSLSPDRLPLQVVDGLADVATPVTLLVVGYETPGAPGYLDALRERARARGVADRLEVLGPRSREELLDTVATCDVGLCILPARSTDVNMTTMVGASNKAFDYLAGGLALLVPDDATWRDTFVAPGYARVLDATNASSIAAALAWCVANRGAVAAMGAAGRQRIEREWNYDAAFAPVRDAMLAGVR